MGISFLIEPGKIAVQHTVIYLEIGMLMRIKIMKNYSMSTYV